MRTLKAIMIAAVLAVALVVPMTGWAANFCAAPVDSEFVDFGSTLPSPLNHRLYPEEVTISKGGTVTFTIVGGGHRIAIYSVSRNTQRIDIEEDLLQADGTGCVDAAPGSCTANSQYLVTDGAKKLVIDTGANNATDRFVGVDFAAANLGTAFTSGTQVQHRFYKTGRYMVICVNRGHFIPDYMFGFVNVVNCDDLNDAE